MVRRAAVLSSSSASRPSSLALSVMWVLLVPGGFAAGRTCPRCPGDDVCRSFRSVRYSYMLYRLVQSFSRYGAAVSPLSAGGGTELCVCALVLNLPAAGCAVNMRTKHFPPCLPFLIPFTLLPLVSLVLFPLSLVPFGPASRTVVVRDRVRAFSTWK